MNAVRSGPARTPKHPFSPDTERDDYEAAWAAGFFDGEGWTSSMRGGSRLRRYLQVGISQKDERALVRFQEAIGDLGHITQRTDQACSAWRANGPEAYAVMERLWPYLGEAKREQFLKVDGGLA